jgi:hypothetical protein
MSIKLFVVGARRRNYDGKLSDWEGDLPGGAEYRDLAIRTRDFWAPAGRWDQGVCGGQDCIGIAKEVSPNLLRDRYLRRNLRSRDRLEGKRDTRPSGMGPTPHSQTIYSLVRLAC